MPKSPKAPSLEDAIQQRRSVRSYTADKLDRDTIDALLKAAVRAPTAVHQEPWSFVVVQNPKTLRRLSDRSKALFLEEAHRTHLDRGGHALDVFEKPDFNIFYNAGTLIVICGPESGPFVVADCWLAAENMMLAACAMGLGTCVIGSAVTGLNTPEIRAELGIPAGMRAVAPIIVGVPGDKGSATSRKEPRILAWK
ncbi:MAG TPA: nitroreductase family protein [Gammaproteobacteria bacterium]|nr:nitroreductase family protein [Gammaproteobacteria bacterium]